MLKSGFGKASFLVFLDVLLLFFVALLVDFLAGVGSDVRGKDGTGQGAGDGSSQSVSFIHVLLCLRAFLSFLLGWSTLELDKEQGV